MSERTPRSSVPARACPRCSRARTSNSPYAHVLRGRVIEVSSDRPFVIYADGDPIATTPATVTVEPRCLRVDRPRRPRLLMPAPARALARLAAGREPQARAQRRHHRAGPAAAAHVPGALRTGWAGAWTRARCWCRPPTARPPRRRWWPPALERAGRPLVHNRAGSNMTWGVATALLDAGRRPRADRPVRGGRGVAPEPWPPTCDPRIVLLANLFRDQLDRYGELESLADRWAELTSRPDASGRLVLNADDPLVADLGRGRERRHLLRGRGRLAGTARAPARRRLEALPQLRRRLPLRRRVPRPHGPLPLPELRPRAPHAAGGRHAREARRHGRARDVELRTPRGELAMRLPAPGPLQRLQRRGRRGHRARARRGSPATWWRRSRPSEAPSGGWRRSPWPGASCRSCW